MTEQFDAFAGQLVPSGVRKNQPVVGLEDSTDATTVRNLEMIRGLLPKITDVWFKSVKVFGNPLDPFVTRRNATYGVGTEIAEFVEGVRNEKSACTCFPRSPTELATQYAIINYAHNLNVHVYDNEVNKAVMSADQVRAYVANKMTLPNKTIAKMKYLAWKQLISNVVDGTRTINSYTASDGTGASVVYNPTVTGYAGMVEQLGFTLPRTVPGVRPEFGSPDDALEVYFALKGAVADMVFEGKDYNKLGIDTFISGQPLLVMEKKVLDAMDNVFAVNAGYKGIPTVSARSALGAMATIAEIDSFAPLPTGTIGNGNRLVATLLDRDALIETIYENRTASFRCAPEYYSGQNFNYESAMTVYKGANSYAIITDYGT